MMRGPRVVAAHADGEAEAAAVHPVVTQQVVNLLHSQLSVQFRVDTCLCSSQTQEDLVGCQHATKAITAVKIVRAEFTT